MGKIFAIIFANKKPASELWFSYHHASVSSKKLFMTAQDAIAVFFFKSEIEKSIFF